MTRIYKYFIPIVLLMCSNGAIGQNTIKVKKKYHNFEGLYKIEGSTQSKIAKYLYFQYDGSVFQFRETDKEKKVWPLVANGRWLNSKAARGNYIATADSLVITPIFSSIEGKTMEGRVMFSGVFKGQNIYLFSSIEGSAVESYKRLYP